MKTNRIFNLLLIFFIQTGLFAQVKINGMITDELGSPLPGATVLEKNTTNGILSDFDGNYSIAVVDENSSIVISYVGYLSQEVSVKGLTNINFILQPSNELNEVVVTGYGTQQKRDLTGSIVQVKSEDFVKGANTNALQLLNGKASGIENEKEGLETGADEYLLKPFDVDVLKLRLNNILRTKQQWIDRFKTNSSSKPWKELSNKLDQKFIEKSIEIVKKNLDDTNFSVEQFALKIGMSRSSLLLKLKSVTGQSSSEFIRTIRFNEAANYIKSEKYSITEVIYMVGYSDPKFFRSKFKEYFGASPRKYLNDFKENDQ